MSTTYGYSIQWTTFCGGKTSAGVSEMPSPEVAYHEALAFAIRCGWTPPRWWQFWRWSDTRPVPPTEDFKP